MVDESRLEQLESRIQVLERELETLRGQVQEGLQIQEGVAPRFTSPPVDPAGAIHTPPPPAWDPAAPPPPPPTLAQRVPSAPTPRPRPWAAIDSETVLKWGGVALVVIAVGFALSTAIREGWIGPGLQLAGALALSAALIAVGLRLRADRPGWTHALCSGGVASLLTTFASDLFLDQASVSIAQIGAVGAGVVGYVLARRIASPWVAATTLIGSITAWLVIVADTDAFVSSWLLLVAVVVVGLVMAIEQEWPAVRFASQAAALVVLVPLAVKSSTDFEQGGVVAAAALAVGSLATVPSLGELRTTWQTLEIQLAAVAAPWTLFTLVEALDLRGETEVGRMALVISVIFALLALGSARRITPPHRLSLALGASVALSIALASLLSTGPAFVAIAIQGAGLVVLSRHVPDDVRMLANAAVLLVIAEVKLLQGTIDGWETDLPLGDDLAHFLIIVAVAVAGWQVRYAAARRPVALLVLGSTLVWSGSVLVHLPQGQAATSVTWAAIGAAILLFGAVRRSPPHGGVGLAVLGLTVAKLFVVDLREVDTIWRAGLFFVVGVALMRLGFLLPRFAEDDEPDDEPSRGDSQREPDKVPSIR